MRIERSRSTLTFRRHRRRIGCVWLTLLVSICVGLLAVSWSWIETRFNLRPTETAPTLQGARAAFASGNLDLAIEHAEAVWSENPRAFEALTILVRALVYRSYIDFDGAQDLARARMVAQAAMQRSPSDAQVMASYAFALQADGQPAQASQVANRALRRDPGNVLARVALALSHGQVGSYDTALRESQRAAEASDSPDAQRALAISLSDQGRYRDALGVVTRAIERNRRLLPLYFEQALYAMQISDVDTATAAYFSVLAFDPGNVKARLRMCELSSTLRESDTALAYCNEVVEAAPTWADGWYRLGREHYLRGEFEPAQAALNRCADLQTIQGVPIPERTFDCWYLQGQIAEARGDCESLLRVYGEYVAMAETSLLPQTWTYPPEGPSICVDPASVDE